MPSASVIAVIGPTAAGKSGLAVRLARAVGGEIVNADSMQIYRGMDIGTAKLSVNERQGVPHHLLDLLDVTQQSTVAEFQALARRAIGDCRDRGVTPLVVGGSALYIRAILDRFEFPGTDAVLRARLESELAVHGSRAMHDRLREVDPRAAESILPTNGRRIVRALEVVELTGGPFRARLPPKEYAFDGVVQIGLRMPRAVLNERIEQRVNDMWEAGLVDEVRALEGAGLREGRTASRALGYAQVLRFLAGECTEEQARLDTVRATRRFARRQDSWFRTDARIGWLGHDDPDLTQRALALTKQGASADRERGWSDDQAVP
jgi:tRNA dimethylallyltransferase